MVWSLYDNKDNYLEPLKFSNGKSQKDIVEEVLDNIKKGFKIIFIKGVCGTGKSAIALNIAKELGKTSIVVPVKALQKQYEEDYTINKKIIKNNKELKISSIVGRQNFKCCFLENQNISYKEKNSKLNDIFEKKIIKDKTCDSNIAPCKIPIKEKNINKIKEYIKQNPNIKITDFNNISQVKRISIASICPYWSPIISGEFENPFLEKAKKIKYKGLDKKEFIFCQRQKGCGYYDQYENYSTSDVLIFNSLKYKLETLMNRKPETEVEIIDECDDFLDGFANQEKINIDRLLFHLNFLFSNNNLVQKTIDKLQKITNKIKKEYSQKIDLKEVENTLIENLLRTILENPELLNELEIEEDDYLFHLDNVARIFSDFLNETYFSSEINEKELTIHLVTPNLAKRFNEIIEKNKVLVMMSGTIHSEEVLRNIFNLNDFVIIDAETENQGQLIKCKNGYEINCNYSNFKNNKTREIYLKALDTCVKISKKPVLIHVTAFSDLPTKSEKIENNLDLPTQLDFINEQSEDKFGKRIEEFKKKKIDKLFTTKCNRGIDFPGDICNSIVVTRFPYPNISSIFWRALKKKNPENFMNFYIDKANREILQKIYRGLRSKNDKIYLLSPDIRVFNKIKI